MSQLSGRILAKAICLREKSEPISFTPQADFSCTEEEFQAALSELEDNGLIEKNESTFRPTGRGNMYARNMLTDFLAEYRQ